ncbi:flavin reductase family protein [Streptomyces sp. NPDC001315]|uniref:flavin reductase family protein n=1 Tax=Streptomyces sp. NPDC001315 TaxID=3364562 RepID=UPI0036B13A00
MGSLESATRLPRPPTDVEDNLGSDQFRNIMGSFPSGITVVTTLGPGAVPRGATVTAFASISLQPPVLMVSLAAGSRTLGAIRRHGAFAVHVLDSSGAAVSQHFAAPASGFDGITWEPSGLARGVPVLSRHTVAHAECLLHDIHTVGDHQLVLGLAVGGRASEDTPLVYHRRTYTSITEELV